MSRAEYMPIEQKHARPDEAPAASGNDVELSVIVVNWNTRDLLLDCLASLREHGPSAHAMEVIVVDNGSADGSVEAVTEQYPSVVVLANDTNRGFAAANNQGLRISRGRYALLMNSDAQVTAGCLDVLLAYLDAHPGVGVIGPRLVYGDGRWQRWTGGREPSLRTAVNHFWFLERLAPRYPAFSGLYLGSDVRRSQHVDWVSGAMLLGHHREMVALGGMDESLFYMEDVDLCRRVREHGRSVVYCPEAVAIHLMGESTRRQTGTVSPAALLSFHKYIARRHGRLVAAGIRGIAASGFALRALMYQVARRIRPQNTRLEAQARAHWMYCRLSLKLGSPSS